MQSLSNRFQLRLVDGGRSAPPEDCGGFPGYERIAEFIETGEDPWGEDPEDLRAWLGDWHPAAFDLAEAKVRLDG